MLVISVENLQIYKQLLACTRTDQKREGVYMPLYTRSRGLSQFTWDIILSQERQLAFHFSPTQFSSLKLR